MTAYTDYLMLISPPEKVISQIGKYKKASVRVIGGFEGMHEQAQISITRQYRCKPYLVQHALQTMAQKLSAIPPFELHIKGFAHHNVGITGKTIYAALELSPAARAWFTQLKKQMGIRMVDFVPQIIVAQNIPVTAFHKLWPHFEKSKYTESFQADRLTILQREAYNDYAQWTIYKELMFGTVLKKVL